VAPGALPYAVKPNRHELEAWAGTPLLDRSALRAAGQALVERGVALVAISMGADGALFIDRSGAWCDRRDWRRAARSVPATPWSPASPPPAGALPDLAGCARLATAFSMSRLGGGDARRLDPAQVRVDRRCTDRAVGLKPCRGPAAGLGPPMARGKDEPEDPGVAMQASTVVIAAGERSIEAVLAAEALRRAARQQRVEWRSKSAAQGGPGHCPTRRLPQRAAAAGG
jgi:hypothetical protein